MSQLYMKSYPDADLFFKKASHVARHYGFVPFNELITQAPKRRRVKAVNLREYRHAVDEISGELITTLKCCLEYKMVHDDKSIAFYHTNLKAGKTPPKTVFFGLHVVGVDKSIAEAMILRVALAILDELGMRDVCVQINSIGDRDSLAKLSKELVLFFRKHIHTLSPQAQSILKRDTLDALEYIHRKDYEISSIAPRPIEFLNESSRKHLWEIIEFLESFGVRYEINDGLIGNRNCYSKTLFEIHAQEKDGVLALARGGRYDELGRKLFRTQIPAVGVLFTCEPKKFGKAKTPVNPRKKISKVYFVHLGFDAKLKSLEVIDALWKARIPIEQSLVEDSLSVQLQSAEKKAVPYVVIMGQKEAVEETVIVRDMDTRSQKTIVAKELPTYLKHILKYT